MDILPRKMRDTCRSICSPQPDQLLDRETQMFTFPVEISWPAAPGLREDKDWAMQQPVFRGKMARAALGCFSKRQLVVERRVKLSSVHTYSKKGNSLFRMLSPQKTSWKTT